MRRSYYLLPLLAALSSAPCFAVGDAGTSASSEGRSTANIDASDLARIVATITGSTGITNVQGDKVELKERTVYVNGRSFGAVPANCEIKYVITKSSRTLFVDGKLRNPPSASK